MTQVHSIVQKLMSASRALDSFGKRTNDTLTGLRDDISSGLDSLQAQKNVTRHLSRLQLELQLGFELRWLVTIASDEDAQTTMLLPILSKRTAENAKEAEDYTSKLLKIFAEIKSPMLEEISNSQALALKYIYKARESQISDVVHQKWVNENFAAFKEIMGKFDESLPIRNMCEGIDIIYQQIVKLDQA